MGKRRDCGPLAVGCSIFLGPNLLCPAGCSADGAEEAATAGTERSASAFQTRWTAAVPCRCRYRSVPCTLGLKTGAQAPKAEAGGFVTESRGRRPEDPFSRV